MNSEKGKDSKGSTVEAKSKNQNVIDLTVFSKNGRFYVQSKEGEWVDVTDKWSGEAKEN